MLATLNWKDKGIISLTALNTVSFLASIKDGRAI